MPRLALSPRSGISKFGNFKAVKIFSISSLTVDEEGGEVVISLKANRSTFDLDQTLYWTTIGRNINENDFQDGQLRGTVTFTGYDAVITRILASDAGIEVNEKFKIQIRTGGFWGPIVAQTQWINISDGSVVNSYSITSNTQSIAEGESVTFTITSPDAPDGKVIYWSTITAMDASDFLDNSLSGSVTIVNGTGTIVRSVVHDTLDEGSESFQIRLRRGSVGGPTILDSDPIIADNTPYWLALTNPSGTTTKYSLADTVVKMNTAGDWTAVINNDVNVRVKCWGAAGGGYGGTGGFAQGRIAMTAGQTYKVRVGGGGKTAGNTVGYTGGHGGGGLCGFSNNSSTTYNTGSGGGLTGLFINSVSQGNSRIIGGGGGGGRNGGGGGGSSGQNGSAAGNGDAGNGGTQTAGGTIGSNSVSQYNVGHTAGSALTGGRGASGTTTRYSGGGAGGGYFGGGGGTGNNYVGGSAGGGSGFLASTSIVTTDRVNAQGSKGLNTTRNAPYYTDIDYINNAGKATSYTIGTAQATGLCVFRLV